MPMTIDSIVDAMTSETVKGKEDTMVFGLGQIRASMSKRFKSLGELKAERERVVSTAEERAKAGELDATIEQFRNAVVQHYKHTNWRGDIDTWNALDDSMRSLAHAVKNGGGEKSLRRALSRFGFSKVPQDVIDQGMESIQALKNTVTDYFEAKPQRAVSLSEFRGAVVPKGTPKKVIEILQRHGLAVKEYRKNGREKAVFELGKQLEKEHGDILFRRAYHGTHARGIERFRLQYIGTGEGAQAFGWGMYFASAKDVGEGYRQKLSIGNGAQIMKDGRNNYSVWARVSGHDQIQPVAENLLYGKAIEFKEKYDKKHGGQLYEVEIPDDNQLLDWDKPLSQQPKAIKARLNKLPKQVAEKLRQKGLQNVTGEDLYDALTQYYRIKGERNGQEAASKFLHSLGIPGLRYLDGFSRNKGEGSHNYVIWDENAMEIVREHYRKSGQESPAQPVSGVQAADVKAALKGLQAKAKNALPVEVVQSQSDLPQHILKANEEKGGGTITAVYDARSKAVYMVADNIHQPADAVGAWMQEAVKAWKHEQGHHGIRNFFRDTFGEQWQNEFETFLNNVHAQFAGTKEYAEIKRLYPEAGKLELAEELFMKHVMEKVAHNEALTKREQGMWKRFLNFVKRLIGNLTPKQQYSRNELERVALGIMGWLEGGRMAEEAAGDLRFSMAGQSARAVAELRHENFDKLSKAEQQKVLAEAKRQLDAVKEVRGKDGKLLAPNGKPSKLNEHQWKQVRTPWFKEWFGDWELASQMSEASEFVDNALSGNNKGRLTLEMNNPDPKGDISQALGGRVVKHEMNANDIRHIMNAHGDPAIEASRGQVAVTPDDIKLIPWILRNYDAVESGSATTKGKNSVRYEKRINGVVVYVEAETPKAGVLSSKTMWIKPSAKIDARQTGVPDDTSENVRSLGHTEKVREILDSVKASQIIDANGEPSEFFHGSPNTFTEFELSLSESGGAPAIVLTDDYSIAEEYSKNNGLASYIDPETGEGVKKYGDRLSSDRTRVVDPFPWDKDGGVYPLFVKAKNPITIDMEGRHWTETRPSDIKKAKDKGHDAVIFKNVRDGRFSTDIASNVIFVFNSNQVKSSEGNIGTFSEQQGDIRFRRTEAGAISDAEASSLFPDVDQRLKAAAKSPGRPGYMQRGKDFLSNMHKAFTRHFIHLDPKQDGAVINILREHQEAATAAWEKAGYTAVNFLKDLSPNERNVFTMNLVLADMVRDIDNELLDGNAELPFGYQNRDQAQKDLDHFQALAERTPAVKTPANRSDVSPLAGGERQGRTVVHLSPSSATGVHPFWRCRGMCSRVSSSRK